MKRIYDGDPVQNQTLSSFRSIAEKATEALKREESTWELLDEGHFPSGADTEYEVFNRLLGEALEKPLENLPLRWRRALMSSVLNEETLEEIGTRLGVTKSRAGEIIKQTRLALLEDPDVQRLKVFLNK